MVTMTRTSESNAPTGYLLLAFELGQHWWKLGFTVGGGQRPRIRRIPAGAVERLADEIARAKTRWLLSDDTPVISCYEAGRDGFWLHRYLLAHEVTNHVVDSSSIEVNRRARRAKSDRLDLGGLLSLLGRYVSGDRRVWRVVRVPSVPEEDARQLHRTWETAQQDRTRLVNRVKGLLATLGVQVLIDGDFIERLEAARLWDGTPLPDSIKQRLARSYRQLRFIESQLKELEKERTALQPDPQSPIGRCVDRLQALRAVGPGGAWVLTTEIFAWRQIQNARQLGALVGLVPAPYQSGEMQRDRGITRAGNTHVRRIMVQLAWSWLRNQPGSTLTQWYQRRFGGAGRRMRRIGVVALARKLLVALWRYVETGTVPEGALLKPINT